MGICLVRLKARLYWCEFVLDLCNTLCDLQTMAKKEGFDNVIYLDAAEKKYLEEVGTSNIFVRKGDTIYTPGLQGGGVCEDTILEGVTRNSVIQVGPSTTRYSLVQCEFWCSSVEADTCCCALPLISKKNMKINNF